MVKMPDGRELTPAEAAREMRENFLPEYTRVTQELAKYKGTPPTLPTPSEAPKRPWADPNWMPATNAELLQAAAEFVQDQQAQATVEAERQSAAVKQMVETQIAEIKAKDPNLNEDVLFQHALKFGFSDLRAAHANLLEIDARSKAAVEAATRAREQRGAAPVATPQAGGGESGTDYGAIHNAGSIQEAARQHFDRIKQ